MEHITTANIALALVVIGYIYTILKAIAPSTQTKLDDQAVQAVEKAKKWVETYAPHFWSVVEVMSQSNQMTSAQKAAAFLLELKTSYEKLNGERIPDKAIEAATLIATGLSAEDKRTRNPQSAPESR